MIFETEEIHFSYWHNVRSKKTCTAEMIVTDAEGVFGDGVQMSSLVQFLCQPAEIQDLNNWMLSQHPCLDRIGQVQCRYM